MTMSFSKVNEELRNISSIDLKQQIYMHLADFTAYWKTNYNRN